MKKFIRMINRWWKNHGTKMIGFASAGIGAVSIADPKLLAESIGAPTARWVLLGSGIVTVWRGFSNSKAATPEDIVHLHGDGT